MQQKRLIRSVNNRTFMGVAAGVADYFDTDPTIVRLIFAVVALVTMFMPVFLIYLVLGVVLPQGYTRDFGTNQPFQPPQQWPQQNQQWGQQQSYQPQQGYQPATPPTPPSTYQGSNELGNMGTPVSNAPQPSPHDYAAQPQPNYGGNANLGNMGQGQANPNPQVGYNPNTGGSYNPNDNNAMRQTAATVGPMVRTNPWVGVLLGLAAVIALSTLWGGLQLVGWGMYGLGHTLGRLIPFLIIGFVILVIANRGRRR